MGWRDLGPCFGAGGGGAFVVLAGVVVWVGVWVVVGLFLRRRVTVVKPVDVELMAMDA